MLNSTSLAAGVGVSVKNVQFVSGASNLVRKILVLATFDPAKTGIVANTVAQVLSPEHAGDLYGFGFAAHRLVTQAFLGGQGTPVFVLPQSEPAGAAAAAGDIDFTTSAGVGAGTLYLYVANQRVSVQIAAAATAGAIATAVVAAITAEKTLPVTAAVNGVTPGQVDFTAKSKGVYGNDISLSFNLGAGETLPAGVVGVITTMTGGSGVPDIETALEALGTGDGANEAYFTDVVHCYGQETAALDAFSAYVGSGNTLTGLYSPTIGRPFRVLTGDTAAAANGLADLVTLANGRKLDRTNGVVAVPGSYSHPAEVAAQTIGHMARINTERAAQSYVGVELIGIHPGAKADRWTNDYDNRDTAVKGGISPTRVYNGVVTLQNVVSFYRPDNVPVTSNGYRSMRNISIIQNMLVNTRVNFEQEKWQGISIVADTARVTSLTDRVKARDIDSVIDDLVALAVAFESRAWIYEAAFTIKKLKEAGAVTIRQGGTGFNSVLSTVFSGEGGILDTTVEFDTSLAVLLGN